jgi:glycosyltransferase involved in cell wall biosynthesis
MLCIRKVTIKTRYRKRYKSEWYIEYAVLFGLRSTPYPYLKNSDIYVQTSRFEGFGLSIAEAE